MRPVCINSDCPVKNECARYETNVNKKALKETGDRILNTFSPEIDRRNFSCNYFEKMLKENIKNKKPQKLES